MKRLLLVALSPLLLSAAYPKKETQRPPILGIAYVKVSVSKMDDAERFYKSVFRAIRVSNGPCDWCERVPVSFNKGNRPGSLELDSDQPATSSNHLKEIAFLTADARKLRQFLKEKQFAPDDLKKCGNDPCFGIQDPEGHHLIFVQRSDQIIWDMPGAYSSLALQPTPHPAFAVRDRAQMDRFYKDVLGFRVYSAREKQDAEPDSIGMQVPEGMDWIEYKLNTPSNIDARATEMTSHIFFTVGNIETVADSLRDEHLMSILDAPQTERDGRVHIDLLDPDGMSVQLIQATQAPYPLNLQQFLASNL